MGSQKFTATVSGGDDEGARELFEAFLAGLRGQHILIDSAEEAIQVDAPNAPTLEVVDYNLVITMPYFYEIEGVRYTLCASDTNWELWEELGSWHPGETITVQWVPGRSYRFCASSANGAAYGSASYAP